MKKVSTTILFLLFLILMGACGDDSEDTNSNIAVTGSCMWVTGNHAQVEGYFYKNNEIASTSSVMVGIEYSTDPQLRNPIFASSNGVKDNRFEVYLGKLKEGTQYFYRACVITNSLHYVGKISSFTTKSEPDYAGGATAYFAYQNPVRTLILGNDIYDNSLDKAHKCRIWATMGGVFYGNYAAVDFVVDPTLCENLWFLDETGNTSKKVTPMPTAYYQLKSNTIVYNNDSRGYVEVQFTDAFFNDPQSVNKTYVIPLRMTNATGIDRILTGTPRKGCTPVRTNPGDWEVLPMDYVLYCVKYMNPWQAKYIRRGVDNITENGIVTKIVRKDMSVYYSNIEYYSKQDPSNPVNEYDEVCGITTKNMTQAIFPIRIKCANVYIPCNLILTFNGNNCTITTDDENVTVNGTGEFIVNGTERPEYKDYRWGSNNGRPIEHDILRLQYDINFTAKNIQVSTNDTLVVETRESNKREWFDYKYVKP